MYSTGTYLFVSVPIPYDTVCDTGLKRVLYINKNLLLITLLKDYDCGCTVRGAGSWLLAAGYRGIKKALSYPDTSKQALLNSDNREAIQWLTVR